jgi:hypothetical protein
MKATKTVLAISKVHTMISGVSYIKQYPETMMTQLVFTNGTTKTALYEKDIKMVENVFDIINSINRSAELIHNMSIRTTD